jgi:peptidoglycan biosynthesis protein MviN/MurJ (putative lipid II flippase)
VSVTIGIGLAIAFTLVARSRLPVAYRPYAAMGIALGGAIGAWVNLLLLWTFLGRKLGGLFDGRALRAAGRLAAAAGLAALAATATRAWIGVHWQGAGFLHDLGLLLLPGPPAAPPCFRGRAIPPHCAPPTRRPARGRSVG